jgi:hypothetical protein
MNERPLIYTTLGNVPIDELEYQYFWIENENEIAFIEEYRKDGEIVKRSVNMKLKKSQEIPIETAIFG